MAAAGSGQTVAASVPTPNAALIRSGHEKSGSGHREKRSGQGVASLPTPQPPPTVAHSQPLPTPNRAALRRRGGWIEFRQKNGRRYARRRAWEKQNGQWVKVFKGREANIPVMTEEEYKDYVYKRDLAKRIRAGR